MKLLENELKRRREIHEYLTATHMFCMLAMLFAFALNQNLFDIQIHGINLRFLTFYGVCLVGFALVTKYNSKASPTSDVSANFTLIDFLYIAFPFAIATISLLVAGKNSFYVEAIILIPVIITSSVTGKKGGLIIAAVGTILIFAKIS